MNHPEEYKVLIEAVRKLGYETAADYMEQREDCTKAGDLATAFIWRSTEQGAEYWYRIHKELEQAIALRGFPKLLAVRKNHKILKTVILSD